MNHVAVVQILAIKPIRQCPQDAVSAIPYPVRQRCAPFPHYSVKTVHSRFGKHPRRTTETGQPHQHPESIVVLYTKGVVLLLRIVDPQAARVEGGTEGSKER
jgi:hypothetical protein